MKMNAAQYIPVSILAAVEAGNAILEIYRSDFKVEKKADDSPITLADRRAHRIIADRLSKFDIPILSEEGKDIAYQERKNWRVFWLVDPLDGTKEFIKKNGEFTVNIALIEDHKPGAGVVFVPDKGILYFALRGLGSFRVASNQILNLLEEARSESISHKAEEILNEIISRSVKLPKSDSTNRPFTVIGSRSHATPELEAFVEEKRREYGEVEFISAGSSLKLCLVAEGRADVYPRTGPTMEWDTAAGQAIVEFSGAKVFKYDTQEPLDYNKENLLNPWFVVVR